MMDPTQIEWYKNLPRKYMGAGAIILNTKNEILFVKSQYRWSVPGGVVEAGESPRAACLREVKEETGLELQNLQLLCIDYISKTQEKDDNLQFIFYGGTVTNEQAKRIHIEKHELSEYRWMELAAALPLLSEKSKKRLTKCFEALKQNTALYLENGM